MTRDGRERRLREVMPMNPQLLSEEEIAEAMAAAPNWRREGKAIERRLVFRDFREAVAFLVRLAFEAEEADHHPDITINYKRVTLSLSTHSAGGLTRKDFDLAARLDQMAHVWGSR